LASIYCPHPIPALAPASCLWLQFGCSFWIGFQLFVALCVAIAGPMRALSLRCSSSPFDLPAAAISHFCGCRANNNAIFVLLEFALLTCLLASISLLCGCRADKSAIFVLDEFDMFAGKRSKQTLLYNLLDALQTSGMQVGMLAGVGVQGVWGTGARCRPAACR
jgi:hypothetical protein